MAFTRSSSTKVEEGDDKPQLDPETYWSTASSIRGQEGRCVEQCARALHRTASRSNAESSLLQFEIVTGPLAPLQPVDTLYVSREIIKGTAEAHATFLPKPFPDRCSLGLHVHLSFQNGADDSKAVVGELFLAGMMSRRPLLCSFGMLTADSYLRLGYPMLGKWVAWGTQNRVATIRSVRSNH